MKSSLTVAAALTLILGGSPVLAQNAGNSGQNTQALQSALQAAVSNQPPGQEKQKADPDQGDDNASLRAINEVCTKDTPAADRSAICPSEPVSPY